MTSTNVKHFMYKRVFFYISSDVVLLDLAGIVQVFEECSFFDVVYEMHFVGSFSDVRSTSGLMIGALENFENYIPGSDDIIFVPGRGMKNFHIKEYDSFFCWLKQANSRKTTICSVCTGAFLLAHCGLLNGRKCTTHWRFTKKLQEQFPLIKVEENKVFVKDENIYTSAGVTTGIDLALSLIEENHDPETAINVAKEIVVYMRRNGDEEQESPYLKYRDHHDQTVHKVQNWIISNIGNKMFINDIALIANCSPRNLTRVFKIHTGVTVSQYINSVRIEKATRMLLNTGFKFEYIAKLCGYHDTKQLRHILRKNLNDEVLDSANII